MRPPLAGVRDVAIAVTHSTSAAPPAQDLPPLEKLEAAFLRQNDGHNPWATAAERDLSASMREFAQGSRLQLPAAMEVSCGGAMCRIKLPLADRRDMTEWGETFPLAIGEILPVITFVPRFQADGSVVLYAFGNRDGGPRSGK